MYKFVFLPFSLFLTSFLCAADSDQTLEVIEVSAQKRLQNINEVSLSVTSLSKNELLDKNIQDSYQLSSLSPNLLISENAGAGSPPAVTIRGVGLVDYNTSNTSPISFYFDEVVNGSVNNQFAELFDMQRVEILRGPQGTLFGRNTSGGAILFFSQLPEQEQSAYVSGGIGTDAYQKAEVMLNLPITDNSATRITAQYLDYDFSATNNLSNAPQEGIKRQSVRWQYQLNTKKLNLNLKMSAADWKGIPQPYGHTGVLDLSTGELCNATDALAGLCTDAFGFNDGSSKFRDVSVDNYRPHETEQVGLSLKLDLQINSSIKLTSISAVNDLDRQHQIHCDASDRQICVGFFDIANRTYSQELRISSHTEKTDWIAGIFLFKEKIEQKNSIDLLREFRSFGANSGAAQYFYNNNIDTESKAIFAQTDYKFTPQTTVTLGLRYNDEQLKFSSNTDLNAPIDNTLEGVTFPFWSVRNTQAAYQWSGKLALNYKVSSDWNVYGSFSNGVKSGGFNGGFLFSQEEAQNAAYEPETLNSYEIGSKTDLWDRQARLLFSAFYYDYKDQQVFINQPSSSPNAPNLQLLKNIPNSTISGIESEFEWQIIPEFKVNLATGYIPTAKFDNYIDPTGKELSDNRQPFTPEFQISAGASYQYELTQGYLMFNVLARFQSKIYFDQNQSLYTQQPAYSLWDANITYNSYDNWRLMLSVKNALDEEYDTLRFDLIDFLGLVNSNKGEGRRVTLEVSYEFGH